MAVWSDLMRAPARNVLIGGKLVFGSGRECLLTGDRVFSLTIEEGADGALTPGCVISAGCTLELMNDEGQWNPGGALLGANELTGASLMPELGVSSGSSTLWQPLGVFVVESAAYMEQQGRIRLQASDSIASELYESFNDGLSYPKKLSEVWRHIISKTRYSWSGTLPNGDAVIDAAPDWKDASLRTAMGHAAAAAGCFVCVDRSGALELRPLWEPAASDYKLDSQAYFTFERDGAGYGPVDALQLAPVGSDEKQMYYADDDQSALYTMKLSQNPLFQADAAHLDDLAQGMLDEIAGYKSTALRFEWRGDPLLRPGDRVQLTDLEGNAHTGVLTRQSLRFAGGFSASCVCALPREMDSGVRRAITPEGGVNAAALTGAVDGALLSVGSITTGKLAAGSITADKIAAGTVEALSLEAVTAKIESLTAQDITTDRLAAAFAAFTVVTAATANFDQATVAHLVANAMNLDFGTAGQVFIQNLAVEYAQMVGAAIGNLCIQASDGNYYTLDVDESGSVTATQVSVSAGEVSAGQTSAGQLILETNITAANLNAGNLLATYALVNRIDAARIDVDELFAREAFITLLRTCKIVGENSIEMIAGEAQQAQAQIEQNAIHDSTQPPQEPIPAGKIWLDRSLNPPVLRRWLDADVDSTDAEIYMEAEGNPVSTGAGAALSFDRIEGVFAPVQEGSGDPCAPGKGKNLISPPANVQVSNASFSYDVKTSGFTLNKGATSGAWGQIYYFLDVDGASLAGKTVTLSFARSMGTTTSPRIFLMDQNLASIASMNPALGINMIRTVIPASCTRLALLLRLDQDKDAPEGSELRIEELQLEVGSNSTPFAPWSNVRPFRGRTGVKLRRMGKNMFYSGAQSFTQNKVIDLDIPLPPGDYNLSAIVVSDDTDSEKSSCGFVGGGANGENVYAVLERNVRSNASVTLHRPVSRLYLNASTDYALGAGDGARWNGVQLETGSACTAYESYEGNVWAADFGRTVYGGTMDFLSGQLKVEWVRGILDGSANEFVAGYGASSVEAAAGHSFIAKMRGAEDTTDAPVYCDCCVQKKYPSTTAERTANAFMVRECAEGETGGARYYFFSECATLDEFRASLAENPVSVVFRLKEPVVIQLSPRNIQPQPGRNTLLSDADILDTDFVISGWETINDTSEIEQILGETALLAQSAQEAAASLSEDMERRVRLDGSGLHIGDSETDDELLLQSARIHFVLDGQRVSTITADSHRFGSMEIRSPGAGGLVIQAAKAPGERG